MLTISHRKQLAGNVAKVKRTTPRDSARGQQPEAVPGPRDFLYSEQDNLRPARGILLGVAIGVGLWALFVFVVFTP